MMCKTTVARLLVLSATMCLPGLAAAQFPYSPWTCDPSVGQNTCSPALIPAADASIDFGNPPDAPGLGDVPNLHTDQSLSNFANAFAKVEEISGGSAAGAAADKAHEEALQALQAASISREDYNNIAGFMNWDDDLRRRVFQLIN